jgi:integral membrane protein
MSSSQAAPGVPAAPVRSPVSRGVLFRYRFMAYFTAVFLLVLVFVAIPIQIWGHDNRLEAIVGQIHGFAYMVYLVCAFELTVRLRIPLVRLVLVLLAGTVPFGAFFAERSMTRAWKDNQRAAREAIEARQRAGSTQPG